MQTPDVDAVMQEVDLLRAEVNALRRQIATHVGPSGGADAGQNWAHPDQEVNSLLFGGGTMRAEPAGILFSAAASILQNGVEGLAVVGTEGRPYAALWYVYDFPQPPNRPDSVYPYAVLLSEYDDASVDMKARLISAYAATTSAEWRVRSYSAYAEAQAILNVGGSETIPLLLSSTGATATSEFASKVVFTPTALTIASGAITVTRSNHTVDTESSGATDDLDTINGGVAGQILVLRAFVSSRTVVVRDTATGGGNIRLDGAVSMSLDSEYDTITLLCVGGDSGWVEISRSNNGT